MAKYREIKNHLIHKASIEYLSLTKTWLYVALSNNSFEIHFDTAEEAKKEYENIKIDLFHE